jgi:hypothetical protein
MPSHRLLLTSTSEAYHNTAAAKATTELAKKAQQFLLPLVFFT